MWRPHFTTLMVVQEIGHCGGQRCFQIGGSPVVEVQRWSCVLSLPIQQGNSVPGSTARNCRTIVYQSRCEHPMVGHCLWQPVEYSCTSVKGVHVIGVSEFCLLTFIDRRSGVFVFVWHLVILGGAPLWVPVDVCAGPVASQCTKQRPCTMCRRQNKVPGPCAPAGVVALAFLLFTHPIKGRK